MKDFILYLIKSYKKDRLSVFSAQASFFIIVSVVPFAAMILSVIGVIMPAFADNFSELVMDLIPTTLSGAAEIILKEIEENSAFHLISIGAITSVWASYKGINGICAGTEEVFGHRDTSPFVKRFFKILWRSFIFSCIIIFSLVLFSIGKWIDLYWASSDTVPTFALLVFVALRFLLFFVFLTLFFVLFYSAVSGEKEKPFRHIPGSVFASCGWIIFSSLYSLYISFSPRGSYLYASFGVIVLFMLWIYFCITIVLIGAEINKYIISVDFFRTRRYNIKKG